MKIFPPSREISLVKWTACCTPFSFCDPHTKTMLFRSFCLFLYSSALWMSSSSELRSLNNILRRYNLSLGLITLEFDIKLQDCTVSIAKLNVVISRSNKLLLSALKSKSLILIDIFSILRVLPWPLPAWALTNYLAIDRSKLKLLWSRLSLCWIHLGHENWPWLKWASDGWSIC